MKPFSVPTVHALTEAVTGGSASDSGKPMAIRTEWNACDQSGREWTYQSDGSLTQWGNGRPSVRRAFMVRATKLWWKTMTSDAAKAKLVRCHLEASITELERDMYAGRYNTLCIRALGSAAKVLGQNEIADRAVRLLRGAPDEAFWSGMLTNIKLPEVVPERMRTIEPTAVLEHRYPTYQENQLIGRIRSLAATEQHIALCLEGRFQEARAIAGAELRLEEIGETLAVIGEFDRARCVVSDSALEPSRQRNVHFVLVIELFRSGRMGEACAQLEELEASGLGVWERVHLALGLEGREPWGGYPYPDQ